MLFGCSGGGARSGVSGTIPAPAAGPQSVTLRVEVDVAPSARESIQASGNGRITQVVVEVVDPNSLDPGTLSGRRTVASGAAEVGESTRRVVVALDVIPGQWVVHVFGRDAEGRTIVIATPFNAPINQGTVLVHTLQLQQDSPVFPGSVVINPTSASVQVGQTQSFAALVQLPNGTSDSLVSWSSLDPGIATVGSSGLATGLAQGTARIRATSVTDPTLFSEATLVVIPLAPVVTLTQVRLTFAPGSPVRVSDPNLQFTATADFSDGTSQDITSVANYVSTLPAVLAVNSTGQAIALSAGTTSVTADFQGVTSAPVSVTVVALTQIDLTFAPAAIVTVGQTGLQFTATGIFSDGTNQDLTATAGYLSTAPGVLSVNAAGQATALAAGAANVTATFMGVTSAPLAITVNPAVGPISRLIVMDASNLHSFQFVNATGVTVPVQNLPVPPPVCRDLFSDVLGSRVLIDQQSQVAPFAVSGGAGLAALTLITPFTPAAIMPMAASNGRLYVYEDAGATPGIKFYNFDGVTTYNQVGGVFPTTQLTIRELLLAPPATLSQFLYVSGITSGDLLGYNLNVGGSPTGAVAGAVANPSWMVQHPSGNFLIVTKGTQVVTVATAANGDIGAQLGAANYSLGASFPTAIAVHPTGAFVYVVTTQGPFTTDIDVFTCSPTGVLAFASTVNVGGGYNVTDVEVNPSGEFLLYPTGSGASDGVEIRPINQTTGALGAATLLAQPGASKLEILP